MKNYNNEILNDCSWFAEKHRGKNKQSGAHWSTIIRFTPLFDEAVRLQNQVRTLLKSIEIGDSKQMDIDKLQAENEKLKEAIELLQNWVKAYPLDMFPEPDLKLARKLLEDGDVNYSALNVYAMRHVINGVRRIIDEALNEVKE